MAAQIGVPAATLRRWFSTRFPAARKARLSEFVARQAAIPKHVKAKQRAQLAAAKKRVRSASAQKAYVTRIRNISGGISVEAATFWAGLDKGQTAHLLRARLVALGPLAIAEPDVLQDMIQTSDNRALAFLAYAESLGNSPAQARSAFFSPRAIKAGTGGKVVVKGVIGKGPSNRVAR